MNTDTKYFKRGIDPTTGEVAICSQVYDILKTFPKTRLRPADIAGLIPGATPSRISNTLHQLVAGGKGDLYPHIHRVERGVYLYDSDMTQTVVTFPAMSKAQRKSASKRRRQGNTVSTVKNASTKDIATVAEATVTSASDTLVLPAPTAQNNPSSTRIADFVEAHPVFSEQAGAFLPVDQVVMLRDSQGNTWLAKRI